MSLSTLKSRLKRGSSTHDRLVFIRDQRTHFMRRTGMGDCVIIHSFLKKIVVHVHKSKVNITNDNSVYTTLCTKRVANKLLSRMGYTYIF